MSALAALADYGSDEDSEDSANAMDVPRAPPVVRAEPPKRKKIYVELPVAAECDDEGEAQVVVTGTSVSGRGNAAASLEDRVVVNAYARRSPPPHAVGDRQTPLVTQDIPAKSTPAIPAVRRKRGMKRAAEPLFPLGKCQVMVARSHVLSSSFALAHSFALLTRASRR